MVKDEAIRPMAAELLGHPWMVKVAHWKDGIDDASVVAADANEKNTKLSPSSSSRIQDTFQLFRWEKTIKNENRRFGSNPNNVD